jgi:hypothetical protein
MRAADTILGSEIKTKKPPGRPRHRWEDIKICIKDCGKILNRVM